MPSERAEVLTPSNQRLTDQRHRDAEHGERAKQPTPVGWLENWRDMTVSFGVIHRQQVILPVLGTDYCTHLSIAVWSC